MVDLVSLLVKCSENRCLYQYPGPFFLSSKGEPTNFWVHQKQFNQSRVLGIMGDHLVLYVNRLITAQTVGVMQAGDQSASSPSTPSPNYKVKDEYVFAEVEEPLLELIECRICQEEDHIKNLESPCACCGSLKYAHRDCVQRWCNEKGDITCEICHEHLGVNWPIFLRWDVPWEWQTVLLSMVACGASFALTGLVEAIALPNLGFQGEVSLDQKAEILFAGQFAVTASVLGVLYSITNTFRPLPNDIFRYDLKDPFKLHNGWLLWAGIGLFGAVITIVFVGFLLNIINSEQPQRETDALIRLLPLIGSSIISTGCLFGITGVLAPLLEETVFRGFLMVSLTKWSCFRVFLCSNTQSSHAHHNTCTLELRSDLVADFSSAPRI